MEHNRNPLHAIGEFSWADYGVFKAHLRLPRPYPLLVFRNYSNMHDAVFALPRLIEKYSDHLWEKMKMTADFKEKVYKTCNIPPQYFKTSMYITSNAKEQADIAATVKNAEKLEGKGVSMYFHSTFAEGAMHAATDILRSAVDKKLRGYCVSFPNVIENIKKWDAEDVVLIRIMSVDLLVLWAVGSEYTTEFTNTQLQSILMARRADNKTTIVVSALSPKEYKARYGQEPEGACVEFTDTKLKVTLADIRESLEKGN